MAETTLTSQVTTQHVALPRGGGIDLKPYAANCAACGQQYPCDARRLSEVLEGMSSRVEYGAIGDYAEVKGISLREASSCGRLGLKPMQRIVLTGGWGEVTAS